MAKSKGNKGSSSGKTVFKKGGLKVISVPVDLQRVKGMNKSRQAVLFLLGLVAVGLIVAVIVVVVKRNSPQMKRRRMLKKWAKGVFGNVVDVNVSSKMPDFIARVGRDYADARSDPDWIVSKKEYTDKLFDAILNDDAAFGYLANTAQVERDIATLNRMGLTYTRELVEIISKSNQLVKDPGSECVFKQKAKDLLGLVDQTNVLHLKQRMSAALAMRNWVGEETFGYYGSYDWPNTDMDYKLC